MAAMARRSLRPLCVLILLILIIYIPLQVLVTVSKSGKDKQTDHVVTENEERHTKSLNAKVTDISPGKESGKLDLVLSIDRQDLLKMVDKLSLPETAETSTALPTETNFVLHNPTLCSGKHLEWIIYVHSSPTNVQRRENLRRTWGNVHLFKKQRFEIIFLLGQPSEDDDGKVQKSVHEEFAKFGDIVQGDFNDNYRNLTLKGIMGLKWVSTFCKDVAFAIKADDDAFVNIFEIEKMAHSNKLESHTIACPLWKDNSMPILRDPAKCMKWCVQQNEFPGQKYFPKYCAGLSYVLSKDMISLMYEVSSTTPFFWIDDVYITGLLPKKITDVKYTDLLKNFTLKEDIAMESYNDMTKPAHLYFVHIKKQANFDVFWRQTLLRLHQDELDLISQDVLNVFIGKDSIPKLTPPRTTQKVISQN